VTPRAIAFPAQENFAIQVNFRHGRISDVHAGPALRENDLADLRQQIEAELLADKATKWGREILFAHRPVKGSFQFSSVPMQILPAPSRAPRAVQTLAEHPFVLEFPFQSTDIGQLNSMRRRRLAIQWARALNALLDGRIRHSSSHPRQLWAIKVGSRMRPAWQQEFYILPGYQHVRDRLSPQPRSRIVVVPSSEYRGGWRHLAPLASAGTLPIDEFYIPDDLDQLVAAYLRLDVERRERFLRSATAIYLSREVWESSVSSSFLACIQAIEALTDRSPRTACPTCGLDTSEGPTKRVKALIRKFCSDLDIHERVLDNLYAVRSAIAHGDDLFQFDEAPWLFGTAFSLASHGEFENIQAAMQVAKRVLRGWLIAQAG
jgi:hypothetical protein